MFAHNDHARTMLFQVQGLGLGMSPRNDRQRWVDGSCLLDCLPTFKGVGNGDEQAARGAQVGGGNDLRVGGIATRRLDTACLEPCDNFVLVLDDEVRRRALLENRADEAARLLGCSHSAVPQPSSANCVSILREMDRLRQRFSVIGTAIFC